MKDIKATESKILDSSVWIAYLFDSQFKNHIDKDNRLFLSILSLFEIKAVLLKRKLEEEKINEKINFIKKKSTILSINETIAEKAAELSIEKNLPAIDSLIYATSSTNKIKLITLDNNFKGLENADVLSHKEN